MLVKLEAELMTFSTKRNKARADGCPYIVSNPQPMLEPKELTKAEVGVLKEKIGDERAEAFKKQEFVFEYFRGYAEIFVRKAEHAEKWRNRMAVKFPNGAEVFEKEIDERVPNKSFLDKVILRALQRAKHFGFAEV